MTTYGDRFWAVIVEGQATMWWADEMDTANGTLNLYRVKDGKREQLNSWRTWDSCHAASIMTGDCVSRDYPND